MQTGRLVIILVTLAPLLLQASPVGAAPAVHGTDYVLLVDNTGTMRYQGRREMALEGLRTFVDLMGSGDHITVYTYGEGAKPVLPAYPVLTGSEAAKEEIKRQLVFSFNADRTDITSGVELAWNERERTFPDRGAPAAGRGRSDAVVVLLTDGRLVPVYDDYSQYDQIYRQSRRDLLGLAALFGEEGIPIHTVGLGSAERIDEALLLGIAEKSGGSYRHVPTSDGIPAVLAALVGTADGSCGASGDPPLGPCGVGSADAEERSTTFAWREEAGAAIRSPESESIAAARGTPCGSAARSTADRLARALSGLPPGWYERYASILAVFVGVVAVGVVRKHTWVRTFTTGILAGRAIRVRGYLVPVDPAGVSTARSNIGLENHALKTVMIGAGTPYAACAQETVVEFIGTQDGSPPVLRVEAGTARVGGELVSEKKLTDGDVIEMEGFEYRYLRGNRR